MSQDRKTIREIPYSVLDLSPITQGSTPAQSLKNTLELARHTETWGYTRYWLAEHHNMPGVASAATSVVIGRVAAETEKIRVGSGGIMLPNHAPLMIAEQFGTLESLFPGRIDLGLGRAPGTDQLTARALRRDGKSSGQFFPELLAELRGYFAGENHVRAIPGEGLNIPIWLLGSSDFSARLAAELGLPFAFASHFSPEYTVPALNLYREYFQPSEVLDQPYAMIGVNVIAADEEEEARRLSTSMQQQFISLVRNRPAPLQPPVEDMDELWNEYEKAAVMRQLATSVIGAPKTVKEGLQQLLDETQADEMMINAAIFDHQARLHSFELVSEIFKGDR
ncbi:LLM class flavin-dependent oxidoreductase [Kroppenstedtia eburnea]|uniref:LLM class flavin-dependent oxidoreductase n=1 Tax=Kroppenstedtia eburnea TaxID=714067 RepID=UPI003637600C